MKVCWCNYGKIPVLKLQWSYLGSETPCAARSPKCPQYIQASRDRPLDLSSIASFTRCPTHPLIKSPVFLCLRALGDERVEIQAEPSGFPAGAQWQKIIKKTNQSSEFKDKLKREDKNERAVMRLDEVRDWSDGEEWRGWWGGGCWKRKREEITVASLPPSGNKSGTVSAVYPSSLLEHRKRCEGNWTARSSSSERREGGRERERERCRCRWRA